jgi:hypothetical protein
MERHGVAPPFELTNALPLRIMGTALVTGQRAQAAQNNRKR